MDIDAKRAAVAELYEAANRAYDDGRLEEAERLCRDALRIKPDSAPVLHYLGEINRRAGRLGVALAFISGAVALKPHNAWYHAAESRVLRMGGKAEQAEASIRRALDIAPEQAGHWASLGMALTDQGRLTEAHEALLKAQELDQTDNAGLQQAMGMVHSNSGRPEDAIACFRRAMELNPTDADAEAGVLFLQHYLRDATPDRLFADAAAWGARHASSVPEPVTSHSNVRDAGRRLRIGYLSGDFRQHPVGWMLQSVLPYHDRSQVEIYCYNNHWVRDKVTENIISLADHWRNTLHLGDEDAAELIRSDEIDVLVDLSGHTAFSRTIMLARRPAPVQALWLGYFDTTGLPAIDYVIGDRFVCPPGDERFFVEKIARLPHSWFSYSVPENSPEVGPLPAKSNGYVTFGCLNNVLKVNEDVVAVWARILRALPTARLVLKSPSLTDPGVREHYLDLFAKDGIDADRIDFSGRSSYQEHLAVLNGVDIALDPFPYNGGATTLDALWMGTPVVTLRGDRFVGRMGASVLSVMDMTELIAESLDQYVELAVSMASDLPRLERLRGGLRDQLRNSPLCDGEGMARSLEELYRQMWRTWCDDEATNLAANADLIGLLANA